MNTKPDPVVVPVEPLSSLQLSEGETGAEELRRVVRCLESCAESALDSFTAEEIIKLVRACWASGWDVWPDNLTGPQARAVIADGEIPVFAELSRGLVALPVRLARNRWNVDRSVVDLVVHEWLCHVDRGDRGCPNASPDADDYEAAGCDRDVPDPERLAALVLQVLKDGGS